MKKSVAIHGLILQVGLLFKWKMGLSSKRKGPWRHRCCHKLALLLVTIAIVVGVGLLSIVLIRAFILFPYTECDLLRIDATTDIIDEEKIMDRAERLAGALRIPTISYEADNQEKQAILKLHQFLEKSLYRPWFL